MLKKMMLMALSVGALVAFAAPAVSQANVQLKEGATPLALGAQITATSTNLVITVGPLTYNCAKVSLHYEVLVNGLNHVVLGPVVVPPLTHNGTAEGCGFKTSDGTTDPLPFTNSGTAQLTISTWGTGITKATFLYGACSLVGNAHIQGKASGTDEINIGPSVLAGNLSPCLPGGVIEGEAILETSDGTPVTLDFIKTG